MTPLEIKIEMLRAGVTQAEIARRLGVTKPSVCQAVNGVRASDRIQREIADAIGMDPARVFPDRYGRGDDCNTEQIQRLTS